MRTQKKVAALVIGLAIVMVGGMPVSAAPPTLDQGMELELRDFLDTFGVDEKQQGALLQGLASGQAWDSFTGDVEPVLIESITAEGITWTVARYPDGSVTASHIGSVEDAVASGLSEAPSGSRIAPQGIHDCGYVPNVYATYYDCNVHFWVGLAAANFVADFQIRAGFDRIIRAGEWAPMPVGACSVDITDSGIQRANETSGAKAKAGFSFTAWACLIPIPYNFYTHIYVGNNTAEHVHNS